MTQLLLRALNPPALLLITALGIAVQTSLFAMWPLNYLQPDVVLLVVIWFALKRDFTEGGILTLIAAQMMETHSSVPRGVFLSSYLLVYLLVRVANKLLVIPDLSSLVVLTLAASVTNKIASATVLHLLSPHTFVLRNTLFLLFPGAAVEGLFAIWGFNALEKFDIATFKMKRSEDAIDEELRMNSEGF